MEWLSVFSDYLVWDAAWVAGVIVGMLLFAYTLGRFAMIPLFSAMVTSAALAQFLPYVDRIPYLATYEDYQQRIIVLLALTIVLFILYRKNRFFEPCVVPSGWELGVFAVGYAGFLLALLASFLPPEMIAELSLHVRLVFADEFPRMFWLLSPFFLFALLRGNVD